MNLENILRYGALKIQIAALEDEIDLMKPVVLQEVAAIRGDTDSPIELKELPGYSFSIKPGKRVWTYTPATTELDVTLKTRQKEEQAIGLATATESEPVLVFSKKRHEAI